MRQEDSPVMSVTTDSRTSSPASKLLSLTLLIVSFSSVDDHNRVQLKEDETVEGSDYINASFIDVS